MSRFLRTLLGACAVAALSGALAAPAGAADDSRFDPRRLTIPALHPIPKFAPERTVLKNGIVVYLQEDHSLPRVYGQMTFRSSATWQPADKQGLAGVTGSVMRTGGSAAKPGDWLDDRLGAIGASVSANVGTDVATTGFYCLKENLAEVIGLLAEVTRRPAFPDDKIELAKVSARRGIAGRNDEMGSVLQRVASQSVFGKDSPYARIPEYATIEAIGREDLVKFHELCFSPDRAILVVYGDFSKPEMQKLIAANFGDWKKSAVAPPAMPPVQERPGGRIVFAPKDDVTQSGVILAHLGFKNDDPDVAAMDVLEQALGGGFQSRLFNRIRTQRGLAYHSSANAGGGFLRPGVFTAVSLTRNDSVLTALQILREEVERVTKEPFSDEELRIARESVENSLVFQYESPSNVAFRQAFYEVAGYPADYLQRYQAALAKVTPQSVLEAAKRHVFPDKLVTILVGKEKDFEKPLESLGMPLERFDLTIPPPPSKLKAGAASDADLAKGRQWLKRAAELNGGSAAWAALKGFQSEASAQVSMQGQSLALGIGSVWSFPNRLLLTQKLPMGEMVSGYDGSAGWRKGFGQVADQPELAATVAENWERSFFSLFGHPEQYKVQALPEKQTVDGIAYDVAIVRSEKIQDWQLFFAPDGQLARMDFLGRGPQGQTAQSVTYADWKAVGSIRYPHSQKVTMGGQPFMDQTVTAITLDPKVTDEQFKKPAN